MSEQIIAVSPTTGNVYIVTEWQDPNSNGHIIADEKRLLERDEVEPEKVHEAARKLRGGASE